MTVSPIKMPFPAHFQILRPGTAREVSGLTGSVFRCLIVLFLQAVTLLDRNRLLISGEDVINLALLKLRRDETDNRDDHKTCQHGKRAGVDRTLNIVKEHIAQRDADTGDEAGPDRELRCLLPVQAIQERCQERAGQRTPLVAHQLRDEGRWIQCQDHRNDDEDYQQHSHDQKLPVLFHVLFEMRNQVKCDRRGRGQHQR